MIKRTDYIKGILGFILPGILYGIPYILYYYGILTIHEYGAIIVPISLILLVVLLVITVYVIATDVQAERMNEQIADSR